MMTARLIRAVAAIAFVCTPPTPAAAQNKSTLEIGPSGGT